jgi:starvation-inducible DNA-binding protein
MQRYAKAFMRLCCDWFFCPQLLACIFCCAFKNAAHPLRTTRSQKEFTMAKNKSITTKATTATSAVKPPAINIGISDKDRTTIAKGLSHVLADTYTLYLTTHNFHWNVTGPMFNTLHTMFMGQYTELWNAVDPIAERIRALGHVAPGSYADFGKLTSLPDAPSQPPKALEMVRILVQGHEAVARTARSLLAVTDKASDEPTADLLTQRLTVHEQTAWMLRSMLQD